jgi:c-di-GMP-binding flagellar brake protein YcgR
VASLLKEKRNFARINFRNPLHFQVLDTKEIGDTVTDNISLGGIGFISQEFLTPENTILLECNLFSRFFKTTGRIAWSSPMLHSDRYRVGVEFQELEPKARKDLTDYIEISTA